MSRQGAPSALERQGKGSAFVDRQLMWTPWEGPGLEHLHLRQEAEGIVADGLIIGLQGERPFRVRYRVTCDEQGRMRGVDLVSLGADQRQLHLRIDGSGQWTTMHGEALPDLGGCAEVDISATPFTNTLPIRRLALPLGAAADVPVAYIDIADFTVTPVPQRYTRLRAQEDETRYLYQGLLWNFRAELPVDDDGLVTDYPGLFRRVWTS